MNNDTIPLKLINMIDKKEFNISKTVPITNGILYVISFSFLILCVSTYLGFLIKKRIFFYINIIISLLFGLFFYKQKMYLFMIPMGFIFISSIVSLFQFFNNEEKEKKNV